MSKNKMPAGGGTPTSKHKNGFAHIIAESKQECKPFLEVIA